MGSFLFGNRDFIRSVFIIKYGDLNRTIESSTLNQLHGINVFTRSPTLFTARHSKIEKITTAEESKCCGLPRELKAK